jgi:hypothetical protein
VVEELSSLLKQNVSSHIFRNNRGSGPVEDSSTRVDMNWEQNNRGNDTTCNIEAPWRNHFCSGKTMTFIRDKTKIQKEQKIKLCDISSSLFYKISKFSKPTFPVV